MRLWIWSDTHMDFGRFDMPIPKDADVAVVAGDVQNDELLIRLGETLPTVYVAGNHDFYGREYHERLEELRNLPSSQLYVLENDELVLDDVRFLGCTLWTDYNGGDQATMDYAYGRMNDHFKINIREAGISPFFRPETAYKIHKTSKNWLKERFSEPFSGKTVVLTHHCPSERSVAPKYSGDPLNHAFFSALDAEIEEWKPACWIHGHTHVGFNYMLGETRVVCNPKGYPGERPDFNPRMIVEI